MSCISPIPMKIKSKFGISQIVDIPCGHCLNCLIKKQQQVEFLSKKELLDVYRSGRSASFVTLTYSDDNLPINEKGFSTLRRSDVQKFIKNIRRQMDYYNENIPFKYLYCGEYGDGSHSTGKNGVTTTCRPHYHLIFLGLSTAQTQKYTRKLWKYGLCDIGELSAGGIRYVTKYMTKATPDKNVKELREKCGVQNPFFYHSIGLGKKWINENLEKIVEDGFTFNIAGKKNLFPKYIMRYVSDHTGIDYLPYVKKFIKENQLNIAKAKGISYTQYDHEQSFIKYKMLVASLRSQNKPVNDITLSKHWAKPVHHLDRTPEPIVNMVKDVQKIIKGA